MGRLSLVSPNFNTMKIEQLALIAIGVYLFLKSQADKISYSIMRNYVQEWGFDGVTIRTDISIKNASNLPINIDGFQGKVMYRGAEIAQVGLINSVNISAGNEGKITVGAKILYGPATAVIIESIRTGRIESGVRLVGTIYADRLKIPVSTNYNLW